MLINLIPELELIILKMELINLEVKFPTTKNI